MPEGLSRPSRGTQEVWSTVDAASDIVPLDRTVASNVASSEETAAGRLQQNDSRRERELSELNAVRGRLNLPPSETSIALTALAEDRERLLTEHAGTEGAAHDPQDDRPSIGSENSRIGELLLEFKEGLPITGLVRRYFEEIGPAETVQRFEKGGPELIAKVRELIQNGGDHELIWRMERLSSDFPNASNTPGMNSIADQDAAHNRFGMKVIDKIERLKRDSADER